MINSTVGLFAISSESEWNNSKLQLCGISKCNGKLDWRRRLTANCKFELWHLYRSGSWLLFDHIFTAFIGSVLVFVDWRCGRRRSDHARKCIITAAKLYHRLCYYWLSKPNRNAVDFRWRSILWTWIKTDNK